MGGWGSKAGSEETPTDIPPQIARASGGRGAPAPSSVRCCPRVGHGLTLPAADAASPLGQACAPPLPGKTARLSCEPSPNWLRLLAPAWTFRPLPGCHHLPFTQELRIPLLEGSELQGLFANSPPRVATSIATSTSSYSTVACTPLVSGPRGL